MLIKNIIVSAVFLFSMAVSAGPKDMTIYKTPTCGCCGKWADIMKAEGFNVTVKNMKSLESIKTQYGIPQEMQSCHTGVINGYVIEGHVPAKDVKELLAKGPKVAGIAVPGMPIGSPGMEQGNRKDHYFVYSFKKGKKPQIFSEQNPPKKKKN